MHRLKLPKSNSEMKIANETENSFDTYQQVSGRSHGCMSQVDI